MVVTQNFKRLFFLLILFTFVLLSAFADVESLLSSSTAGLFTNALDWVIRPNQNFNGLENDYVIALGNMGLDTGSNTSGGSELGYYHHGKYPFAISSSFYLDSTTNQGEKKNKWDFLGRFTIGIPQAMDLSLGLVIDADGGKQDATDTWNLSIALPFGLQIGPVYNYAHPYFAYERNNSENKATAKDDFKFCLYDEVIFQSLIPGGVESKAWLVIGTKPFIVSRMPFVEPNAFPQGTSSIIGGRTNGQAGLSNRYDFSPIESIKLIINPKFYMDWYYNNNAWALGFTLGSDVGINYRPKNSMFGMFFAMTPCVILGYSKIDQNYQTIDFLTDIEWTGRLGATVYLPQNITLDIACAVNVANNPFEVKVQMAFTL